MVWTGTEMIVWGGTPDGNTALNTGGRYNPTTDSWTATNPAGAPTARFNARARWISATNQWIVWGGTTDFTNGLNTGGRYNPTTDSWTATNPAGAPTARFDNTMVRSGSNIIVWGGTPDNNTGLNTGGIYNAGTDSWTPTTTVGAPSARFVHSAVRRGTTETMIVWGGFDGITALNTGGIYDPAGNSWTATNTAGAPSARALPSMVWTGTEMIVWGGTPDGNTG